MLIKKEKIEDLEFMEVEPEDEELGAIVMKEEDKVKKAEEEYNFEVRRAEKKRLKEVMKRVEVSEWLNLCKMIRTERDGTEKITRMLSTANKRVMIL